MLLGWYIFLKTPLFFIRMKACNISYLIWCQCIQWWHINFIACLSNQSSKMCDNIVMSSAGAAWMCFGPFELIFVTKISEHTLLSFCSKELLTHLPYVRGLCPHLIFENFVSNYWKKEKVSRVHLDPKLFVPLLLVKANPRTPDFYRSTRWSEIT